MYSAQRTVWVRYCIIQLCHKLDERGNPYQWWIFTHDLCQRSLLCETHGQIFTHKVCCEKFTMVSHGWIFTPNVHCESVIMFKSWVNFHPLHTWCKWSSYKGWIFTHKESFVAMNGESFNHVKCTQTAEQSSLKQSINNHVLTWLKTEDKQKEHLQWLEWLTCSILISVLLTVPDEWDKWPLCLAWDGEPDVGTVV